MVNSHTINDKISHESFTAVAKNAQETLTSISDIYIGIILILSLEIITKSCTFYYQKTLDFTFPLKQ
jgi:hypothetical protein